MRLIDRLRRRSRPNLGPVLRDGEGRDLKVLSPDAFLRVVVTYFRGGDSRISLEGWLRGIPLPPERNEGESGSLRRHTIWPRRDFFVTALDGQTVKLILAELLKDPNWTENVEHFQIERGGQLTVGAYDGLDDTWIGGIFDEQALDDLVASRVVEVIDLESA